MRKEGLEYERQPKEQLQRAKTRASHIREKLFWGSRRMSWEVWGATIYMNLSRHHRPVGVTWNAESHHYIPWCKRWLE